MAPGFFCGGEKRRRMRGAVLRLSEGNHFPSPLEIGYAGFRLSKTTEERNLRSVFHAVRFRKLFFRNVIPHQRVVAFERLARCRLAVRLSTHSRIMTLFR